MRGLKTLSRALTGGAITIAALTALSVTAMPAAATETKMHDFTGADGGNSFNGLLKMGNKFYGTSTNGGANGLGTVFKLQGGVMTVLHSFAGGTADGALPRAGVIAIKEDLYGTTYEGGAGTGCTYFGSCGTVFKTNMTTGATSILYSFQGGADGSNPFSPLIFTNGQLYGTTVLGGTVPNCVSTYPTCGTVFSLTLNGVESVLYAFKSHNDGANTISGLLEMNGKLFGTTGYGGAACPDLPHGCGTVYKLTPAGTAWNESVVYRFLGGNDGADPYSSLTKSGSLLYGTTFYGGTTHNGIVYSVTPTGTETVIHGFLGGSDGSHPYTGLVNVGADLYGTTSAGGISGCGYYYPQFDGCGTIYKLGGSTGITTMYSFLGGADGGNPYPHELLGAGGHVYGTTYGGGANGVGTIFDFQ